MFTAKPLKFSHVYETILFSNYTVQHNFLALMATVFLFCFLLTPRKHENCRDFYSAETRTMALCAAVHETKGENNYFFSRQEQLENNI